MKQFMALAGAAALALTTPALADKGEKGGGGSGGGKPAKVERGGGKGGGKAMKADRRGGGQQARKAKRRGGDDRRAERRDRGDVRKAERGTGKASKQERQFREVRAERGRDRVKERREVRVAREDRGPVRSEGIVRERDREDRVRLTRDERYSPTVRYATNDRYSYRSDNGCPPGLAAKNNGCLPPGQAKKLVGTRLPDRYWDERPPAYYSTWYPDDDRYFYRSGDGYIYRVARDTRLVSGFMPLYDWDDQYVDYYHVGEPYPIDTYSYYNVPTAYQPYYADSDDHYYRYGDGAIYQVDRGDGLVEAIVALLAGDLAVGSPLPAGYDMYNVPLAYRDRYHDTPDAWYRYNDGYIYQVDPQTRLVESVIEALV